VRCLPAETAIRCTASDANREFHGLSAFSATPFSVDAGFAQSGGAAPARTVTLRAVELIPVRGSLRVIAPTDLEAYVAGVVAGEAAVLKSPAARAAMAIVARTWALRWRGRHSAEGFDFCSLTHCQVFHSLPETRSGALRDVDEAVRSTAGRVLKYQGELADPYFSAHCGGVTESARDVWPDRAQPYLLSVPDPYCAGSEHASWEQVLSLEAVSIILRAGLGIPLSGPVTEFTIEKKDSSGRAHTLRAVAGSDWRIDANAFRYAANRRLGWNTLKSNLYTLERRGGLLVFTGRGLGHGVGLCQAGAEQMGRMGFSSERILATYYPGATVVPLAAKSSDPIASSEHFELLYPESEQPWVNETLQALENSCRALGNRAEALHGKVRIETWATTEEFIRATGQPAWMAAGNDGQSIALQPLGMLRRKGILNSTLHHELTHLVVHHLRAAGVPHWFEEGLVLYLTHEQILAVHASAGAGRSLEEAVVKPRSEEEMRAAYARALQRVRDLVRQQGDSALWRILQRPTSDDLRWLKGAP
jgi:stage II sporulation protein D